MNSTLKQDSVPILKEIKEIKEITCTAPVNIAVIKYWGKKHQDLVVPLNPSLSVTLDQKDLRSTTTTRLLDHSDSQDRLILNGKEEIIQPDSRLNTCLTELREWRQQLEQRMGLQAENDIPVSQRKLLIVSENNFPTAAGLASSASGYAALAFSIYQLFQLQEGYTKLSALTRLGSGSACRSIFGGFVEWISQPPHSAIQLVPDWPDLEILICVVSDKKKQISSSKGMAASCETSKLLQTRVSQVVPERLCMMKHAIKSRNFDNFAEITMAESNQFHAICLDTTPPIFYLNDISRSIIQVVQELSRTSKPEDSHDPNLATMNMAKVNKHIAAYTFDAGPNAVIFALKENMPTIINTLLHYFPLPESEATFQQELLNRYPKDSDAFEFPEGFNRDIIPIAPVGSIQKLILTRPGPGPIVLSRELGAGLITLDGKVKSLENGN